MKKGNNNINRKQWDTTSITPGTEFMNKLHKGIDSFFKDNNITSNTCIPLKI